jgi:nitrite reductase (NADH) large subunit
MSDTSPNKQKLVVIGNGMAGMRVVEELLEVAPDLYEISVFGAEPHGNYNRIMLSPVLAGEKTLEEIMLNTPEWYQQNNITLHTGDPVVEIRRGHRTVISESGLEVPYDRLLVATGSSPFIIPIPGYQLPGVVGFRDVKDVDTMAQAAADSSHAIVIGGGLLGLEAAHGLQKRGMHVTVVHLMDSLMDRQLDELSAHLLKKSLEAKGVEFEMGAQTHAILGKNRVEAIQFADGRRIPAALVVMAAGIRPNIELAKSAGLHCDRAIVVSDTMQTYDPRVYAVGECVQHRGVVYGLVAPIWDQARICANHLSSHGVGSYGGNVLSTTLKVSGINLFSAGEFNGGEDSESLIFRDAKAEVYKRLVIKDNKLIGAVMYGDTADGAWYFELINKGHDISAARNQLIFGKAYAEPMIDSLAEAA